MRITKNINAACRRLRLIFNKNKNTETQSINNQLITIKNSNKAVPQSPTPAVSQNDTLTPDIPAKFSGMHNAKSTNTSLSNTNHSSTLQHDMLSPNNTRLEFLPPSVAITPIFGDPIKPNEVEIVSLPTLIDYHDENFHFKQSYLKSTLRAFLYPKDNDFYKVLRECHKDVLAFQQIHVNYLQGIKYKILLKKKDLDSEIEGLNGKKSEEIAKLNKQFEKELQQLLNGELKESQADFVKRYRDKSSNLKYYFDSKASEIEQQIESKLLILKNSISKKENESQLIKDKIFQDKSRGLCFGLSVISLNETILNGPSGPKTAFSFLDRVCNAKKVVAAHEQNKQDVSSFVQAQRLIRHQYCSLKENREKVANYIRALHDYQNRKNLATSPVHVTCLNELQQNMFDITQTLAVLSNNLQNLEALFLTFEEKIKKSESAFFSIVINKIGNDNGTESIAGGHQIDASAHMKNGELWWRIFDPNIGQVLLKDRQKAVEHMQSIVIKLNYEVGIVSITPFFTLKESHVEREKGSFEIDKRSSKDSYIKYDKHFLSNLIKEEAREVIEQLQQLDEKLPLNDDFSIKFSGPVASSGNGVLDINYESKKNTTAFLKGIIYEQNEILKAILIPAENFTEPFDIIVDKETAKVKLKKIDSFKLV